MKNLLFTVRSHLSANDRKENSTVLNKKSECINSVIDKSGTRAVFRPQGCSRSSNDILRI